MEVIVGDAVAVKDDLVPPPKPAAEKLKQRSVGLPEKLWDRVDELAAAKGYRTSEYLRTLIERVVAREEELAGSGKRGR
jgi:metal-responsive CopG/Arc/MetJ family transcriptional regulator